MNEDVRIRLEGFESALGRFLTAPQPALGCASMSTAGGPFAVLVNRVQEAVLHADVPVLEAFCEPLRHATGDASVAGDLYRHGCLDALLSIVRRALLAGEKTTCDEAVPGQLIEARLFLASIASAQSQGTREQTDWMIAQAREGLRRAGGHDFDASGDGARPNTGDER